MTSTEARTRVKYKFGIPSDNTIFDDDIDEAVSAAVDLLAPYIDGTSTTDTSQSLASTATTLTYANTPDRIWYRYSDTEEWQLTTNWYYDGGVIYFTEDFGLAVDLKILYFTDYDISTIGSLTKSQTMPMIDFACSEFASFLAGSRSHYNSFMQTQGARAVDSMTDLSNFYEGRAERRAMRIADSEGVL